MEGKEAVAQNGGLKERTRIVRSPDHPSERRMENKESPELFRATIGFDFVFSTDTNGQKVIKCVELNGEKAGISGIRNISRKSIPYLEKILAEIRSKHTPEFENAQLRYMEDRSLGLTQETSPQELIKLLVQREEKWKKEFSAITSFKHAYKNPPFVERITKDKLQQQQYIPEGLAPRIAHNAIELEQCLNWIVKPVSGSQGKDISVLDREHIKRILDMMEDDEVDSSTFFQENIVQELLSPLGADNAEEDLVDHPASLRLLVDFRYLKNDDIRLDYVTGYQRVSQYSKRDIGAKKSTLLNPETGEIFKELDLEPEAVYVVNKSKGAVSFAMSKEEGAMAVEAAEKIIKNLGQAYKSKKETNSK